MNPNRITLEEKILEHPNFGRIHTYRRIESKDDTIYVLKNDIPLALGLKRFVVNKPIASKTWRPIIIDDYGNQRSDMVVLWSLANVVHYLGNVAHAPKRFAFLSWVYENVEAAWGVDTYYETVPAPPPEPESLPGIELPKVRLKKYIKKGEVKQYEDMLKHLPGNETGRRENKKWLLSLINQYADTRGIDTKEAWKVFVKQYDQDFGGDLLKEHRAFNRGRTKKQDLPRYFISTHKMYRACKSAYAMNMETKTQKIWWRNQEQKAMVLNRCS